MDYLIMRGYGDIVVQIPFRCTRYGAIDARLLDLLVYKAERGEMWQVSQGMR